MVQWFNEIVQLFQKYLTHKIANSRGGMSSGLYCQVMRLDEEHIK